jgi:signal transduction histidine kinase
VARDEQRRRVAQGLHGGVERELAEVSETMRLAGAEGAATDAGVRELIERELDAAREELASWRAGSIRACSPNAAWARRSRRSRNARRFPVTVVAPSDRLPVVVEAAAYFVCSEALANVAKYAQASRVRCELLVADGRLTVTVSDDGVGDADPDRGSGLRGLADRVEALGGRLTVSSPAGERTTITADLPVQGMH